MAKEPLARQSSILGLIVAANLSDSTYGRGFELSNESFCATRSLKTVFGDHSQVHLIFRIRDLVPSWHGYRQGVALYYHHWDSPLKEHSELGLTSEMTLAMSLIMRQTHLLGSPFIECTDSPGAANCIKKGPVFSISNFRFEYSDYIFGVMWSFLHLLQFFARLKIW